MRYLRRQIINRRAPYDSRLGVDINDNVIMSTKAGVQLPTGTTLQRPTVTTRYGGSLPGDIIGMMRYNTTTSEVEVYQGVGSGKTWRSLRYKESTQITKQDLGVGDAVETIFGKLIPTPPVSAIEVSSGTNTTATWTGNNILVFVENVFQIFETNYTIISNPIGKPAGYYVAFDTPVPFGKHVTVYHGFDQ